MLISQDQIQELYEINDDPRRKEFLDDLFSFMQKRGTPINRLPIMAKSVLDLYELYNLVIARGGLVDVINKKLWQEIIKGLRLPSSITSAAFTLRTQYMKYLYPYECEKKNLSTPTELQAAIDGNRREGRRSSYGQYEAMHNQMQMPQMNRQSLASGLQQISPLALVTHAANTQQAQAAVAAVAAHHRLMTPPFGQIPNTVTQEFEQRMIEYLKMIHGNNEQNGMGNGSSTTNLSPQRQHHHQQQRQRSQSPDISPRESFNALEMSRVALWQMYQNNSSPPASVITSPLSGGNASASNGKSLDCVNESQRSEILNLSELPPNFNTVKREREQEPNADVNEESDFLHQPPPQKCSKFYLPPSINGMSAAASTANSDYKDDEQESDTEMNDENEDKHNKSVNSTHADELNKRSHLDNSSLRGDGHNGRSNSVHNEKSDDSAIENSPTTSGNSHISPVSTKNNNLPKPTYSQKNTIVANCTEHNELSNTFSLDQFEALKLLSGMQFRITRNGSNSNGLDELEVNLEVSGVKYTGVLVANTSNPSTSTVKSSETTRPSKTEQKIDNSSLSNNNANITPNENSDTHSNYATGTYNNNNNISNSKNNNSNETIKDSNVTLEGNEEGSEAETLPNKSPSKNRNNSAKENGS